MKKTTKPQPMNYGPYVIEPPSGGGPCPMWHVRGPALDLGSTNEQSVRMRACEANARLMAAAPDLLAACKGLLDAIHDSMTHAAQAAHAEQIDAARAAITKAEGGAQ